MTGRPKPPIAPSDQPAIAPAIIARAVQPDAPGQQPVLEHTVTAYTSPDGEPTLADIQREYPEWHCWRAISGLLYARPADAPPGHPAAVHGEDPIDLRDQIRLALSREAEAAYQAE
jgi:hypothetical protein